MIRYNCPTCQETLTLVVHGDMKKGARSTCLRCGTRLVLCEHPSGILLVAPLEIALRQLFRRKEKGNAKDTSKEKG